MNDFKARATACVHSLIDFLKHPINGMKSLPIWPWEELAFVLLSISAFCGAGQGIVSGKIFNIFAGLIFFPIGIFLLVGLASGFFYYVFLFFFQRQLDFKQIATIVTFATFPSLLVSIASPALPPVALVGFAATLVLLIVGFTENFQLPRKKVTKLLVGVFLVYLLFWIYNSINTAKVKDAFRGQASPESMEILEQELKEE